MQAGIPPHQNNGERTEEGKLLIKVFKVRVLGLGVSLEKWHFTSSDPLEAGAYPAGPAGRDVTGEPAFVELFPVVMLVQDA